MRIIKKQLLRCFVWVTPDRQFRTTAFKHSMPRGAETRSNDRIRAGGLPPEPPGVYRFGGPPADKGLTRMALPENTGRQSSTGREVNAPANPLHCRGIAGLVAHGKRIGGHRREAVETPEVMKLPFDGRAGSRRPAIPSRCEGFACRGLSCGGRWYEHSSPMRLSPGIRPVHRPGVLQRAKLRGSGGWPPHRFVVTPYFGGVRFRTGTAQLADTACRLRPHNTARSQKTRRSSE
jgi:hypothetical protein